MLCNAVNEYWRLRITILRPSPNVQRGQGTVGPSQLGYEQEKTRTLAYDPLHRNTPPQRCTALGRNGSQSLLTGSACGLTIIALSQHLGRRRYAGETFPTVDHHDCCALKD
jgi:hypothetical protein